MPTKTGLGRGLGALIPRRPAGATQPAASTPGSAVAPTPVARASVTLGEPTSNGVLRELPLDRITADPNQPRKHFDHHSLEELSASIKEHGILQPLVVTPPDASGQHTLIAGERRLRAATLIGLKTVPVIVRDVKEQGRLELSIIENVQRADLNPIEEAAAYQRLMDEFNLTQEDVGKRVGKSRPGVANSLRLLELPADVQQAVAEGKISSGHAKILASLDRPGEQESYLDRILKHNLTVRELEEQTKTVRRASKRAAPQRFDPVREAQEELLRERFGTKTIIKKSGGKGQILIHFYSEEELKRLLNELT
ncbi:MAG: ParB/RepB/Spo0J family partition protein [Parcubacteria group bacterium]|nr:ParB/RepB/Spo0J family partition protein [Parcubacteria group bacterium]